MEAVVHLINTPLQSFPQKGRPTRILAELLSEHILRSRFKQHSVDTIVVDMKLISRPSCKEGLAVQSLGFFGVSSQLLPGLPAERSFTLSKDTPLLNGTHSVTD